MHLSFGPKKRPKNEVQFQSISRKIWLTDWSRFRNLVQGGFSNLYFIFRPFLGFKNLIQLFFLLITNKDISKVAKMTKFGQINQILTFQVTLCSYESLRCTDIPLEMKEFEIFFQIWSFWPILGNLILCRLGISRKHHGIRFLDPKKK